MSAPFHTLAGKYAGQPIVVMGGAPCLPSDVDQVKHAAAWISANEHGAILGRATHIFTVDFMHQRRAELMENVVKPFGLPVISRYASYADYRITQDIPKMHGNSGLQAIYIAYLMGAWPAIVTGIEMYTGGTYFHDATAESSGHKKTQEFWDGRLAELSETVPADYIRVVSGPLTERWKQYDPDEQMGEYVEPEMATKLRESETKRIRFVLRTRVPALGSVVMKNQEETMLASECKRYLALRMAREVAA